MFESFYGLTANPFRLTADERFRYAHKSYVKAWSYLKYALELGEGLVLITGRPGTGKTTLIRDILAQLDSSKLLTVQLVTNQFQGEELLRMVALDFGFQAQDFNKVTLLTKVRDYAAQMHARGRRVIILVDEAQNLTENGLEELCLLSNLQVGNTPLFQLFLIGQEELRSLIYGCGLDNIQQRILAACRVEPMDARQVEGYIEHRLGIAGWHEDPCFEEGLFPLIRKLTKGIPREVNNIVGRLLLYGALEEKHLLTMDDLRIVAQELHCESRADFDLEEVWPSDNGKLVGAGGERQEAERAARDVEIPERSAEVEAAHEERSLSPPRDARRRDRERQAFWHDDILGEGGEDDCGMGGFGGAGVGDSDLELPSILIDEEDGALPPSHRLDDAGAALLDERAAGTRSGLRWRWFFYPGAFLLAMALLMSGAENLRLVWGDAPGHPGAEQTHAASVPDLVATPQTPQWNCEILPVSWEPSAAEVIYDEVGEQGWPSLPAAPPQHTVQMQTEPPPAAQSDPPPQPPRPTLEQAPPSQEKQPMFSQAEPADAEAGREIAEAIVPGRSYFIVIDRKRGEPLPESLDTLVAVREFVGKHPRALIVLAGFVDGESLPLERMREALWSAEKLVGYFLRQGLSQQRISIEGGLSEDSAGGGMTVSDEPGMGGHDRVRLRVILLRGGRGLGPVNTNPAGPAGAVFLSSKADVVQPVYMSE